MENFKSYKSFKDFLTEETNSNYEVGQSVKVDLTKLTPETVEKMGSFDYGTIKSKSGNSFVLKCDNGMEVTVSGDAIISFGDAGDAA